MLEIRHASERGRADFGWLDSRHSFSFGSYYDPAHMGFRDLRVINDDRVDPGAGFPSHPHRDMEILTYVLDGALEHRDSMGNGSVIAAGDLQRMSAGTGVVHSEYNHSPAEPVRFLQIWILPERRGLAPGYEQKHFSEKDRADTLRLIASPDGEAGSVSLNQDARLYAALLSPGTGVRHALGGDRHAWIQVARGSVRAGDVELVEGDGLAASDVGELAITGGDDGAEILLFDLA
jgi:hypothetical protein